MKISAPVYDFNDLLKQFNVADIPGEKLLPIVHMPKPARLKGIIKEKLLKPNPNNKYYETENLLFFNYGRNAYVRSSMNGKINETNPPFVFLFDLSSLTSLIQRALPFDSGGFDLFKINTDYTPESFELKLPSPQDLLKFTYLLFKGHENYLKYEHDFSELGDESSFPFFQQIKVLNSIYTKCTTETDIGPQAKSIELHFACEIPLKPTHILYPLMYDANPDGQGQIYSTFPDAEKIPYWTDTFSNPYTILERINEHINQIIRAKVNIN